MISDTEIFEVSVVEYNKETGNLKVAKEDGEEIEFFASELFGGTTNPYPTAGQIIKVEQSKSDKKIIEAWHV